MKSRTCKSGATGKFLTEYFSEGEAQIAAEEVKARYGNDQAPYRCDECCGWHLAPSDRNTPTLKFARCFCMGRNGEAKAAYENEASAVRRAKIRTREGKVRLEAYYCGKGDVWHLRKARFS